MGNYDKHAEEVNLSTLFWFAVSKWKSILVIAIIGLIIGTGYAVMSAKDSTDTISPSDVVETEGENPASVVAEQAYNATIERVEFLETYITEATIMEINPYDMHRGTVVYAIDGKCKNLAGIDTAIYSMVWDGALMAHLEKNGPYTTAELDYLLGLTQSTSASITMDQNATGQTTARITINAKDKNEAQQLLAQIDGFVKSYLDAMMVEQFIIGYEQLSTDYRETTSSAVDNYQINMRAEYDAEKANLDIYKANMEVASEIEEVTSEGVSKTTLIKYGGVGFVGGIIVAVVIWILIYFLCGRLYTVSDKERRFGVKQLGTIHDYRKLKGVDLWVGHKIGGVYSYLSLEEQKNVAFLNVKNELQKNIEIKKVFLVSSLGGGLISALGIRESLENAGYIVEDFENVIGRADLLKRIAPNDAVVVIEDNKNSKAVLVEEEINILKEYTDTVLGLVILQNRA